jgi:hypothetical protein
LFLQIAPMNLQAILNQLKQERDRLNNAIQALEGVGENEVREDQVREKMSAGALKRIRAAQKKRWAVWRARRKS